MFKGTSGNRALSTSLQGELGSLEITHKTLKTLENCLDETPRAE